jgi:hypothetical protein
MKAADAFFQNLHNTADSDATDMVVGAAANFDCIGPAGKKNAWIHRLNFELVDGSISPNSFGGITALTNGCRMIVVDPDGTEQLDFLDGRTIKNNSHWALLAGSDMKSVFAAGDDSLPIRWTLSKGLGEPLELPTGWRLRFAIQDALTGITQFSGMAQGYLA